MTGFNLDDYIDVAERITLFYAKYPEGSLQGFYNVEVVGERTFIVYEARAYRTPDDRRPAHGKAWEPFPGPTPYTRDSELQNAETAAWGRAIAALGIATSRSVASKQEVIRAQAQPEEVIESEQADELAAAVKESGIKYSRLCILLGSIGADAPKINRKDSIRKALASLTPDQHERFINGLAVDHA